MKDSFKKVMDIDLRSNFHRVFANFGKLSRDCLAKNK